MNSSRWAPRVSKAEAPKTEAPKDEAPTPVSEAPVEKPVEVPTEEAPSPESSSMDMADSADMDQFAQTREPDNLFDDDFTPIPDPIPTPIPPEAPRNNTTQYRPRGNNHHVGTDRPFLRGSRQRGSAPIRRGSNRPQPTSDTPIEQSGDDSSQPQSQEQPDASSADGTAESSSQPSQQIDPARKPAHAVRGPRLATGGVQKPKLTEQELSERLAAAKINNAKREAAHAAAEADEASFHAREAQAAVRRREEGVRRKEMDSEREKNRMRKLKGKGGREWDEGKEERDNHSERGGHFKRGAHGAVVGGLGGAGRGADAFGPEAAGDGYEDRAFLGRGRGRGRGARGRGRGREKDRPEAGGRQSASLRAEDFPALETKEESKPSGGDTAAAAAKQPPKLEPLLSPIDSKGTWAEQVEAGGL